MAKGQVVDVSGVEGAGDFDSDEVALCPVHCRRCASNSETSRVTCLIGLVACLISSVVLVAFGLQLYRLHQTVDSLTLELRLIENNVQQRLQPQVVFAL